MLNQYESNVKATIAFLQLIKVKVNNATVNETLQNHPEWPSLLCISDSLKKWNIPNAAAKMDMSDIDQLPVPFMAYMHDSEFPLQVVTEVSENQIRVIKNGVGRTVLHQRNEFLKSWSGIYIIAEPNEQSGEHNYEINKKKAVLKELVPIALIFFVMLVSLLPLLKGISALPDNIRKAGFITQYFLFLTGIVVTLLLLWYEIDKNNPILKKVCTGIAKGNCSAILTSKQSKLFNWLSWSEIGFFYFAGSFIFLLFAKAESVGMLAWLSLLAVPYTIFSIHYQWRVAKHWCLLCLAVQALLLVGGTNAILNRTFLHLPIIDFRFLSGFILSFLFPILAWYTIKPWILRLQEAQTTKREYLRTKFDIEIFDMLLKKQKHITISTDGLGITIGNPNAKHEIIKVCNPYCGPCAKVHPELEALLHEMPDLKARIIFNTPNDERARGLWPVKHLLAIAEKGEIKSTREALDDWYNAKEKAYDVFAAKHPVNGELKRQTEKIEAMHNWCKKMEIEFTPTIFIDGQKLPDAYSIGDLKYFLLE